MGAVPAGVCASEGLTRETTTDTGRARGIGACAGSSLEGSRRWGKALNRTDHKQSVIIPGGIATQSARLLLSPASLAVRDHPWRDRNADAGEFSAGPGRSVIIPGGIATWPALTPRCPHSVRHLPPRERHHALNPLSPHTVR